MYAAFRSNTAIVTALIKAGADVNAKNQVRMPLVITRYMCVLTVPDMHLDIDDRMTGPLL